MNINSSEITLEDKGRHFVDLPDDILFTIFSYCSTQTLCRICRTCSRLKDLASRDCVWTKESPNYRLMVFPGDVNITCKGSPRQTSAQRRKRKILLKDRCRIAKNWETKIVKDTQIVKHKTKLMPWARLHGQKLYVSNAVNINCYDVFNNSTVKEDVSNRISGCNYDVTKFVVNDDVLVSGFREGRIIVFDTISKEKKFEYSFDECGDTQAVAVYNDTVVAGYQDGSVKVLNTKKYDSSGVVTINNCSNGASIPNRVWSVATAPDGSTFTVGNAGLETNRTPVEVYDLESCRLLHNLGSGHKRGAGVLDIKYETSHIMLTCGYDTSLRLWDLRTLSCEKEWTEPFDTELSSIQSDGNNVMLTGTFQYGMTRLWDKRLNDPVQMYYCGQKRSPVYCLDTDFQRLFVALDWGIHMLDFTVYNSHNKHVIR
ncbi:F-box/WD repeat-containing protein 4-like [Mytilus edulis]|uniref:F-box/WD repeat-containing protein 4-like n=1 Tax=Mytilus edulis TaxID=6550 RepID=UPI0039EFE709